MRSPPLHALWLGLLALALTGAVAQGRGPGAEYLGVTGPCNLDFPRDHGAHPGYRTEWWYYTGNVLGPGGNRYGFQLTFFRVALGPPGAEKTWPQKRSAWRTRQLFLAHAALSDIKGGRFYYDERTAREALGLAGTEREGKLTRVFIGAWSAEFGPDEHHLQAEADDFALDLYLTPLDPPITHGVGGYSLKGQNPASASCYYSFTRLKTSGNVSFRGRTFSISGTAWMDHEFGSAPLEKDLTGWDWFGLQLSNNTELMLYLLRDRQGGYSPASSGTFVKKSGKWVHVSRENFHAEILDHWKSPHSGALYPSRWRIKVPALGLDLMVTPNLADQELNTSGSTQISYWEGSVSVKGSMGAQPLDGVGYVEMTGYARPFNLLE